jgi:aminomethyltransferase
VTLHISPLDARHRALGAKMVPFGGWDMPIQYATGTLAEHRACRTGAAGFDVSHLGTVRVTGADAFDRLQAALTNDLGKIAPRRAQYTHLLDPADASVLDDIIVWWVDDERFDVMPNASNTERVRASIGGDDVTTTRAIIAVQGPEARRRLAPLAPETAEVGRFRVAEVDLLGRPSVVAGTGYTGEDGVELLVAPEHAGAVWDALLAAEVVPIGLAARDTLRLEVCFHLYGNDLMETRGPIEAGLGWCCKEATGFVGSEAIARTRADGPAEKLVPFVIDGPGIARQGNAVVGGGEVTSGTLSPSLDAGIGMAYVPAERAEPGTPIEIDVRGKIRLATVKTKPLYTP